MKFLFFLSLWIAPFAFAQESEKPTVIVSSPDASFHVEPMPGTKVVEVKPLVVGEEKDAILAEDREKILAEAKLRDTVKSWRHLDKDLLLMRAEHQPESRWQGFYKGKLSNEQIKRVKIAVVNFRARRAKEKK